MLVCKPARQSKRRVVLVSGLGMPDSRDWERTSVGAWGLCRDEQRLRRQQDEGDGETGHGGEVRQRKGRQRAVMWVYSTHTVSEGLVAAAAPAAAKGLSAKQPASPARPSPSEGRTCNNGSLPARSSTHVL